MVSVQKCMHKKTSSYFFHFIEASTIKLQNETKSQKQFSLYKSVNNCLHLSIDRVPLAMGFLVRNSWNHIPTLIPNWVPKGFTTGLSQRDSSGRGRPAAHIPAATAPLPLRTIPHLFQGIQHVGGDALCGEITFV